MDEDAKTRYNPDKPYQYSPLFSMGLKYKNDLTDMQYKGLYHDNLDHRNRNIYAPPDAQKAVELKHMPGYASFKLITT